MIFIKMAAVALGLALAAVSAVDAVEGDPDNNDGTASDKGKVAIEAWIDRMMKSDTSERAAPVQVPRKVEAVDLVVVRKVFPDDRFYSVHFKKMPRPDMLPKALQRVKLVRLKPDGSLEPIEDLEALKKLLCSKLSTVRDETQARAALLTCIRLAEEFYRDGDVTFSIPDDAISVSFQGDRIVATGKTVVSKGGKGEVRASLNFGPSGSLKADDVKISGRVLPNVLLR